MDAKTPHVIIVTYPAQGHINPLLQFAKCLVSKGLKATFATTRYTIKSINEPTVTVEAISDGFDESGFHQSSSLEAYLDSFKTHGTRTLTELVQRLIDPDDSPDMFCIVYDSLLPWALDVARKFGAYAAVFLTNSASVCSIYWQIEHGLFTLPVEKDQVLSLPGLPPLGYDDLPSFVATSGSCPSPYLALIMEKLRGLGDNDWVFCNSFEELEPEVVKALKEEWPLVMIGPMVPSAYLDNQIAEDKSYGASLWNPKPSEQNYLTWLNTKQPNSVVYVSFGSMAKISPSQIEEIAWGLKSTDTDFLWVIKDSVNELPAAFIDLVGRKGLFVRWCNQLEVLAHEAVGCFVTHCGWNSTLEGLSLGVPLVCLSQWSDQPMNAKFIEDVWGVGVRAKRDCVEGNMIVRREEVEACLREVMFGERSGEIRRNACRWSEVAKRALSVGGSSYRYINEFVVKISERKIV